MEDLDIQTVNLLNINNTAETHKDLLILILANAASDDTAALLLILALFKFKKLDMIGLFQMVLTWEVDFKDRLI